MDQQLSLTEGEVLKILEKIHKNFKLNSFVIKRFSEEPVGFLAEHFSLKLNIDEDRQLQFFIKTTPRNKTHLKYVRNTRAFYKEIEIYKTVFEDIKKVQNKLTIDTRWRPEYYHSIGSELIVLEDLSRLNYKLYEDGKVFDKAHIETSLVSLAKMHAGSFILEQRVNSNRSSASDGYLTLDCVYPDVVFETEATDVEGHVGNTFYKTAFKSLKVLLKYVTGYSEEQVRIVKENFDDELNRLFDLVKPSKKYKNVFINGDLWSNNIMFRYNKDGEVDHALIVDYQLARYAPPAHEIMMFLHLTLSKEYRQENENRLIDFYYKIFSEELEQYGLSSDTLLPYDVFKESCDYYQELGALKAVVFFQLILLPPEISSRFLSSVELFEKYFLDDRTDIVEESFLSGQANQKRMLDGLNEVIQKYILKT